MIVIIMLLMLLLAYQWVRIIDSYNADYGYIKMVEQGMKGTQEMKEYYQQPDAVNHWIIMYWTKQSAISLGLIILISLLFKRYKKIA